MSGAEYAVHNAGGESIENELGLSTVKELESRSQLIRTLKGRPPVNDLDRCLCPRACVLRPRRVFDSRSTIVGAHVVGQLQDVGIPRWERAADHVEACEHVRIVPDPVP